MESVALKHLFKILRNSPWAAPSGIGICWVGKLGQSVWMVHSGARIKDREKLTQAEWNRIIWSNADHSYHLCLYEILKSALGGR